MTAASQAYDWDLDLGALATIWRGGCIIRARFLNRITRRLRRGPGARRTCCSSPYFRDAVADAQDAWRRVIVARRSSRASPIPAFTLVAGLLRRLPPRARPREPHPGAARLLRRPHLPARRPRGRVPHPLGPGRDGGSNGRMTLVDEQVQRGREARKAAPRSTARRLGAGAGPRGPRRHPRAPGHDPGPGAPALALRADARVAVRVLSRGRGDHGDRPRRHAGVGHPGPGVRRRAPARTSASSRPPTAGSSSTSTTSTRPCPARGSGTSSGSRRASRSPAATAASPRRAAEAAVLAAVRQLPRGRWRVRRAWATSTSGTRGWTSTR